MAELLLFHHAQGRTPGCRALADGLLEELVSLGLSLGVLPAQLLAQTRAGARGAVLLHGCVAPEELRAQWPPAVPVEVHPGDRHRFSDRGRADHDEEASALVTRRMLDVVGDR